MTKPVSDFGASARARLHNLAKKRGLDFQLMLQRYIAERFLYRLGASSHRESFVLKGAMLFVVWDDAILRPTRDVDLAGYWTNDAGTLEHAFREICSARDPRGGVEFNPDSVVLTPIRREDEYHGFRVHVEATLAGAVVRFQVDVGFGDAIVPPAADIVYPALLDADAPRIRAYTRETAVSEKLHAMVVHGELNSRYKDFFDAWLLSSRFAFDGAALASAIAATFQRRRSVSLAPWPVALTHAFFADEVRAMRWKHYLARARILDAPSDFAGIGARVIEFLALPARAVIDAAPFARSWNPPGPWT